MAETSGRRVRRGLKHPVIDADGHWLELQPIFLDYLGEVAGARAVDRYKSLASAYLGYDWYRKTPAERARNRVARSSTV